MICIMNFNIVEHADTMHPIRFIAQALLLVCFDSCQLWTIYQSIYQEEAPQIENIEIATKYLEVLKNPQSVFANKQLDKFNTQAVYSDETAQGCLLNITIIPHNVAHQDKHPDKV
jgi:hypothetical protein